MRTPLPAFHRAFHLPQRRVHTSICALALLAVVLPLCFGPELRAASPGATVTPIPTAGTRLYLPLITSSTGQQPPAPPPVDPIRTDFGLVFVNSAEEPSGAARILRGANSGAIWDRFPLYWSNIEPSEGQFIWTGQDTAIRANEAQGLDILGILLGTPGQYASLAQSTGYEPAPPVGASFLRTLDEAGAQNLAAGPPPPRGLFEPIFADGSDRPGPGKTANPGNPWARFVEKIVNRYRPGGNAGTHVRHWEVWNEPDLRQFWSGNAQDYARLLKVAYLVIKQNDPQATVLWGGLAHFEQPNFLYDLIQALSNDPMADEFNGFFDAAASHHYASSSDSYQWTARVRSALNAAGYRDKAIWITESGVPICNDYPFSPEWGYCPSPYRGSPQEQAAYVWQNVAYTRLAGGGPIFHFNLHDDCGNVVAPNSPDGFGLIKNESNSYCSPSQAEPRLAYTAYQLAIRYFSDTELLWADIQDGKVRRFAFYEPVSRERRLMVFDLSAADATAHVPATAASARLIALNGSEQILTPAGGEYVLSLPGATNRNRPNGSGSYDIGIYGEPYLLIEKDTLPPTTSVGSLPTFSPPTFEISWQADDLGSGLAGVALWHQVGQSPWRLLRSGLPDSGSTPFTGEIGLHYRFALLATDRAGNALTTPIAQAETTIAEQPPQVQITGQVLDVSGAPATGVPVSIGTATCQTDASGHFQLSVAEGGWDVQVSGVRVIRGLRFEANVDLSLLLPPAGNPVVNWDFESTAADGLEGWQRGGDSPLAVESRLDSSDHYLRLATSFVANPAVPGGPGGGSNSTISQPFRVPSGHPYLALQYKVESAESEAGSDRFEVILFQGDSRQDLLVQQTAGDWRFVFLDLSSYAGSEVTLTFNLYQYSADRPTSALIDLVAVGEPPTH